jgi:phosphate transport system substrate-binding protein
MSLSGSHDVVSLADLIQVAAQNRRRARIRMAAGDLVGVLYIDDGAVVHASFGGLDGNTAVYHALAAPGLVYQIDPDVAAPWRNVTGSTTQLVLEAARLADEGWTPVPTGDHGPREISAPVPVATARRDTMSPPVGAPASAPRRTLPVVLGAVAVAALGVAAWAVSRGPGTAASSSPASGAAVAAPAEAPAAGGETVEATALTGAGDAPPHLLEGAPAPRPRVDLALTPTIVCRLRIDATGAVTEARVFRSRLDLAAFEDAALTAVSHYRFQPARKAGAPVAVWINWPVGFRDQGQTTTVRMKGSDTIGGALGPALADAFSQRRPDVTVTVEALGSSTAFGGLFDGSADLGASSRPVNAKEIAEAQRLGVALVETVIGYDGLAIIVHPDNPIAALGIDEASRLFRGEVTSWRELGGPDLPVRRLSRPTYSGTYEFFRDKVVRRGDSKAPGELAADTHFLESSREIAEAVAADPGAVAYAGLGWVGTGVRAVPIRAGAGGPAIAPTVDTVRDGSYPIYRTLLVYTRGAPRGDAAAFLAFALSKDGQALTEKHGFVAPGPGAEAELAALIATGGSGAEPAAAAPTLVTRIGFAASSSTIAAADRAALRALGQELRPGGVRLLVVGNADAEGARTSHDAIAAARAKAVADVLRQAGVPADRITVEAAGSSRPLESNNSRSGRSHNRRVDVFVAR